MEITESGHDSERNSQLFAEAQDCFPGGVNSPVRSFSSVGGTPLFAAGGSGPLLRAADGHDYIDLCCSWGALPLGHADRRVQTALARQIPLGFSYGMPTEGENQLARRLQQVLSGVEQLRFVSSGTEACMSALRVARAFTGRDKILKFEGCYHGHADYLLAESGSGVGELGPGSGKSHTSHTSDGPHSRPGTSGIPPSLADLCLTRPYNDLAAAERLLEQDRNRIAAVIVEPVAANMGLVLPDEGFLAGLRRACDRNGSLLIFDEVITGLRQPGLSGPTDAATYFGIEPDLSCFGKAIGGGLPLAAYGGKREIMAQLVPSPGGHCYQAGTLSGNPLATAAGLATINALFEDWPAAYAQWQDFIAALEPLLRKYGATQANCGSLLSIYPEASHAPRNFAEAQTLAKRERQGPQPFSKLFHGMLQRDIYLSPSPYEALFLSTAHSADTLDFVLRQLDDYFRRS
ncbi:glutamate-1-semialdehyde 2,1-aminomutase [Candidatus Haliotispira prima]|uniref:Glutamate-1-semialdehyde 2,1-aminomutase n=1 Tax=Candidatus Haliotispira prima TaxID=3034016 RepID=A0ABY8MK10_9SPIO|nr:glutamate-1-semialdehyde 2,1-aminomutase [Candidatus Haliotispira prima]